LGSLNRLWELPSLFVDYLNGRTDHQLLVFGVLAALIVPTALFVADRLGAPIGSSFRAALRWLREMWGRIASSRKQPDVAAPPMPIGPQWKIPKWTITPTDAPTPEPTLIAGYRHGPRIDYRVNVFAAVDSYMEIPAFFVDLHFKPGYTVLGTFDGYGLSLGPPQRSELSTPNAFWNKVTLRELAPQQAGTRYGIGYIILTAYSRVPANLEVFWLVRFGQKQRYPERSYGRFAVRFEDPKPTRRQPRRGTKR
jgi:hypothetical protein